MLVVRYVKAAIVAEPDRCARRRDFDSKFGNAVHQLRSFWTVPDDDETETGLGIKSDQMQQYDRLPSEVRVARRFDTNRFRHQAALRAFERSAGGTPAMPLCTTRSLAPGIPARLGVPSLISEDANDRAAAGRQQPLDRIKATFGWRQVRVERHEGMRRIHTRRVETEQRQSQQSAGLGLCA